MKQNLIEKAAYYFPVFAGVLCVLWFAWWFAPLGTEFDPVGAYKLVGYILLDVLFLLLSLFGFAMSYRGMPLYDISFVVFCCPAAGFLAHLTEAPWCYVLSALWLMVVAFFIFTSWRNLA